MKLPLLALAAVLTGCAGLGSSSDSISAPAPALLSVEIVYDAAGDVAIGTSLTDIETVVTAGGAVLTGQTPAQFAALTP